MNRPQTRPPSDEQPKSYVDLEVLRDADGLIAVISQRRSHGALTFGLFREYDRDGDGQMQRTAFFHAKYAPGVIAMAKLALERITALQGDAVELSKLQAAAGFNALGYKGGAPSRPSRPGAR